MSTSGVDAYTDGAFGASGYVRRIIDNQLDILMPQLPAVLLDGPKGVGKTATALQRAHSILRLDDPKERNVAVANVDRALAGEAPFLVDEWHRVVPMWDAVKRAVDANPSGGRFLLTGSAPLRGSPTHSGAGRITTVRMRPLSLPERGLARPTVSLQDLLDAEGPLDLTGHCDLGLGDYVDAILRSGFPGFQTLTGPALRVALDGYIDRIVERDMDEAGITVRRPLLLRSWLRAYAAATATATSWEKIRDAASAGSATPARSTTIPFTDTLTALRILDHLPAWSPGQNRLRRLTQGPRHHLVDPALAARLVKVDRGDLLAGRGGSIELPRDGSFLGALFESLAVQSVRVFAQNAEASVAHLRTRDSEHEVDLIVQRGGRVVAFEVKLSAAIDDQDVKHLRWLRDQIGDQLLDAAVLTTGPQAYRRQDGIAVIPLGLLGP